jgi:iron complex transport system substrate-binding protein
MAAGPGSLIGQLIQLAGGANVAPASSAYPQLSAEQVLAAAPDIVVAFHMLGHDQGLAGWPPDSRIPAVRNHRIYSVDPALFARPGPRVIDALEALARIIHPEIFGEFTP